MLQDNELTGEQSLELIARMINKARKDYYDTGFSALLWGSVITFCALVTFANYYLHWDWLGYFWVLTFFAVVPQILIAIRESKARKHKGHDEDQMSGIWIAFAITIFLYSFVFGVCGATG